MSVNEYSVVDASVPKWCTNQRILQLNQASYYVPSSSLYASRSYQGVFYACWVRLTRVLEAFFLSD